MDNYSTQVHNINGTETSTYIGGLPDHAILGMIHAGKPWNVAMITVSTYKESDDYRDDDIRGEVVIHLDVERGRLYKCPCCGTMCKPHEYENRSYFTVKFLGHRTEIRAKIPKLACQGCGGYPQIEVPWARPRVGYTVELEKEVLRNLGDRPITAVSKSLGIGYWVIADIVKYRVQESLKELDLSNVSSIYVDETSFRKGHRYVTVICDQEKRIIFMCEGKGSDTIDRFTEWLQEHGGDPEKITSVSCDMGDAYPAGVRRNLPNANIVFDKFHVVKLISDAFDKCRRRLLVQYNMKDISRSLAYKHAVDLSDKEKFMIKSLDKECMELSDAYRVKETLCRMYNFRDKKLAEHYFGVWYRYVRKCGQPEMEVAAKSLWERMEGILMWYDYSINNGFAEGVNSLIQTTKRVARGYRNVGNFINMCFLRNGKLKIVF